MKLLIITQVMDTNHPILGFFHGWVKEFAKSFIEVHVICLQKGECSLPDNVHVYSLGKEDGENRLKYLYRFYKYIWSLRTEYDHVFVHMNQIYVILGAPFWRVWGKRVGLWYAHGAVTSSLFVSVLFSHIVFTSTPQGMRVNTSKRAIVGQGIDSTQFISQLRAPSEILRLITIGRVAQSKNIDTLLRSVAILKQKNIQFKLRIIGGSSNVQEERYFEEMISLAAQLGVTDQIVWVGPLAHEQLPAELVVADIFVHDGSTNSLDKTLVEASFAGCVVISSNPSYRGLTELIAPELLFPPNDYKALSSRIFEQQNTSYQSTILVREALLLSCGLPDLISSIVSRY